MIYTQPLRQKIRATAVITLAVLFTASSVIAPKFVSADRFEAQIQELQQQNQQTEAQVETLESQAATYEGAIQRLREEIAAVESIIAENQRKQKEIEQKIVELEIELAKQREVLGTNIKAMYVGGEMTTIEMLATSKDLSEFVDKETYRSAVQRKIQQTMDEIEVLQSELGTKKAEIETLLREQNAQRVSLSAKRVEQSRLLAMNQQQQDDYAAKLKSNNSKIADLRAQQAIENARLFGGGSGGVLGGGGYPWGSAVCLHTGQVEGSCWNYDWSVNGNPYNYLGNYPGGWGFRNCTDWVAFRSQGRVPSAAVIAAHANAQTGGVSNWSGNAKWWDDAARHMGKRVSSEPLRGDTAVSNAGNYGHVMYVEAVNADKSIVISDYNQSGTGKYKTTTLEYAGYGQYRNTFTGSISTLTFVSF